MMAASLASRIERRLPTRAVALLRWAGRAAAARGERAYLVGGVVRDLCLGRQTGDLDVVVEGDSLGLAREAVRQGMAARAQFHERFGTATLWLEGGLRVDLARCRSERYAAPAALPEVAAAGLRDDLARRDFTVNALAAELGPTRFGRVLDLFGGRRDLERRTIRVLHENSFRDDPTRAFRAARFAARLGFRIEPATARWIGIAARDGTFAALSAARLRRELELLLEEEQAPRAVRMLNRLGVLGAVHPGLRADAFTARALGRASKLARWLERVQPRVSVSRATVGLGVLAMGLRRAERSELVSRLRPTRCSRILLLEGPEKARALERKLGKGERLRPSEIRALCKRESAELLVLAAATASGRAVEAAVKLYLARLREARPDLTGSDLVRAGIRAGPEVSAALEAALAAKLDGRARGREEQWRVALETVRRHSEQRTP